MCLLTVKHIYFIPDIFQATCQIHKRSCFPSVIGTRRTLKCKWFVSFWEKKERKKKRNTNLHTFTSSLTQTGKKQQQKTVVAVPRQCPGSRVPLCAHLNECILAESGVHILMICKLLIGLGSCFRAFEACRVRLAWPCWAENDVFPKNDGGICVKKDSWLNRIQQPLPVHQ